MGPKMFTTRPCLLKKGAVNRIKPQDAQEVTAGRLWVRKPPEA